MTLDYDDMWVSIMANRDFNLIVSTYRRCENDACSEIWFLLGLIGDKESVVERTDVSGLIVTKTSLDPFKVVHELRRLLKEKPEEFQYTLRVIPVETIVRTDLEEIRKACTEISSKIAEDETFRVTVEKRHTKLPTKEIVEAAAENINRRVNLENPDKILLIEVLGGLTGISVVKPEEILSVMKEK